MSVEFLVIFPLVIIVAVIATNALLFFSDCASFDRVARGAIRIYATSPTYGQSADQSCARARAWIEKALDREYLEVSVDAQSADLGFTRYTAALEFKPNLFGMGLKSTVFGIDLPGLKHQTSLTVDTYRPGVIL